MSSPVSSSDLDAMRRALDVARRADAQDEIPVGAIVLGADGAVIGEGHNARVADGDPTAHAEVVALRAAGARIGSWNLEGCTIAVTLEPCTMCAGAIVAARIARVVFGAWDPKAGAMGSLWDVARDRRLNHRPEVIGGVLEQECGELLTRFFTQRRGIDGDGGRNIDG